MSLKEIKNRIVSVTSTQKITSAMKRVSSAKLHHQEGMTLHLQPYEQAMDQMARHLVADRKGMASPLSQQRPVHHLTVVAFSANNGLCGSFNANIIKELTNRLERYRQQGIEVSVIPIGKQVEEEMRKAGYPVEVSRQHLIDKPTYAAMVPLADLLADRFLKGETDRIEILYHHFKNAASQPIQWRDYLPIPAIARSNEQDPTRFTADWIQEPSPEQLQRCFLPKVLRLNLYAILLDTTTAEQAARVVAMQTACDNANELLQQLTLQYNKSRQQAITNELMDIMGGKES